MKLTLNGWYEAWEGPGRRGGGPRTADSGTRRACLKSLSTTALANRVGSANGRGSISRAGSHRFYWVEEYATPPRLTEKSSIACTALSATSRFHKPAEQ